MARLKLLIADDDDKFGEEVTLKLGEQYDIVGVANNGMDALSMVREYQPDIIILDIIMPSLDGFGVLNGIRELQKKPRVIVVSELSGDAFVSRAMSLGASFYMLKPINMDMLKEHINAVMTEGRESQVVTRGMEEKIANIFLSVGIPAHIKGYQFLREAIKMAIEEPEIINSITKRLYPSIAMRFNTSASKVERAIRHAIEVAWARGKIENINSIFGIKVYSTNEKPTNGEFIALVADKMLIESAS